MTRVSIRIFAAIAAFSLLAACGLDGSEREDAQDPAETADTADNAESGIRIDVRYRTLDNGLRVVLAPDSTIPTVTVGVYYGIGFRIEPRDRTGFAHLFEHLMFQGSRHAEKGEFDKLINGSGGVNNGSTRFDFTNYFEVVPSNALEPVLWIEADRMAFPDITQEKLENQQGVVANEVKVNVLNQPYGGFPWLDMPQYANENWYNAHNFYGELDDLEAATLSDARDFHDKYYAPNNAVLVIAGDFAPSKAMKWVEKYFGPIPQGEAIALPDLAEPRQEEEKTATKTDPRAPRPALAFAYHMPERGTDEYYAMALLDQILIQGEDSRLYQALVKEEGYASGVEGGINLLGNMFNYNGPMLWTAAMIHGEEFTPGEIMASVDEVVEGLREEPVTEAELERAKTKLLSEFYGVVDSPTRFGLVDLLASFALFDDDPARINRIEGGFDNVTPALMLETAEEYLRPGNRTVLRIEPGAAQDQE